VNSESVTTNILQPFELLASALSGRTIRVAQAAPDDLTWTDGNTVFVDVSLSESDQIKALAVQASMLAAGSFAADVMRRMTRHPAVAIRYLAVESHRALAANSDLLPIFMHSLCDTRIAIRCASPAASLAIALSRETIATPSAIFGAIRASRLIATNAGGKRDPQSQNQLHQPRHQRNTLTEIENDDVDEDGDSGFAVDMFSAPGGAGPIGRWLQRFLNAVRQGDNAGGTPGIDAPTHRARSIKSRAGAAVLSTAAVGEIEDISGQGSAIRYPEWDTYQKRYRPDWCFVQETVPVQKETVQPSPPESGGLHRRLARIGLGLDHRHRQVQGDDIDIDAAIEARIELMAGSMPDETVYIDSQRRRRDLSVLILLDISGSAAEAGAQGQTVHEQQRTMAAALASVLHNLGDRVALYAYNSRGRSDVQMIPVKRFDDHFNAMTLRRLYSLVPGAYSRLGAAIRHGSAVLEQQGGTPRRLLLVLSDGLAYDHGYEIDYGAADARRALAEARRRGTGSLCLTIGASTDAESLRRVFGSAAHATISKTSQLSDVIAGLFQTALRSAEVRRRVS
jgi:hypothetical protein